MISPYLDIECDQDPKRPHIVKFTFSGQEGTRLHPQQIIDALSDFFISEVSPDLFPPTDGKQGN